jgi:hypothetical protein
VGRWGQPDWEFKPVAATAVFAGWYFSRLAAAALVPLLILVISDLGLPAYDSFGVMVIKYVMMLLPVLFGRNLFSRRDGRTSIWRWGLCGLAPATLFYLTTNLAVWAFESDYPQTLAGLVQCYAAGVPFFRAMLAGDLFYLAVLFGCAALAGERLRRTQPAESRLR